MPTSLIKLLNKYSVPGGRYTYNPPHAQWKNDLNYFEWWDSVKNNYDPIKGVDLYVHIPFCKSVCTFCGCNIRVTKSYQDIIPYLDAVKKEWNFYKKILGNQITINSLYIGGGTPNFLEASDLDDLLSYFLDTGESTNPQISVEIDPRFLTMEQLQVLKKHRVHTLSFGVQDLSPLVLGNVNRDQKTEDLLNIINEAKKLNFPHLNIDLIYGLTHQTAESFCETLNKINYFHVDSIALYPFAKVPWQNNSQKVFGDFKDFSREELNEIFSLANEQMSLMGYEHIGMGHFARINSNFHNAFSKKVLKRNIMGFTERKSNLLIGLGVSSFSSGPTGHIQNEKVLEQYLFSIQKDRAPILKSHKVSGKELEIANIFEKIICENYFTISDKDKIANDQLENFNTYLENNFITFSGDKYTITHLGRFFLKNICQCWG